MFCCEKGNVLFLRMSLPITTERLLIDALTINDHAFIFELLNTEGWINFIGQRNIHTKEDAVAYIDKILANNNLWYQVARLRETTAPIGLVTLIKRDYLAHHDIGFAFLPAFNGQGYAYEATMAVLQQIKTNAGHSHLLATTIPQNTASIRLIKKLGLQFREAITEQGELLHVYGALMEDL